MRMRKKSVSVHRDYGNFIMVLYIQSRLRIRQKFLACMENTLKEYERIWRIRQEYFAVLGNISHHLTAVHDRMGKKPSHPTRPTVLLKEQVLR
jgi:hypothetical protein